MKALFEGGTTLRLPPFFLCFTRGRLYLCGTPAQSLPHYPTGNVPPL